MTALYLASQSPRRAELLGQIGVQFTQFSVDVPEIHQPGEAPNDYVLRLAKAKAEAGWASLSERNLALAPVLGSDTVVVCDQHILEKPKDFADFVKTLTLLSGRSHKVLSAVAVFDGALCETALASTEVFFRPISVAEMARYWQTGEPLDKAGGYGIQGLGAVFVESISGSYSNVVGLPLEKTVQLLNSFGIEYWQG